MCTSKNTHRLLKRWQPASFYEPRGQASSSHGARNPLSQAPVRGQQTRSPAGKGAWARQDEGKQEGELREGSTCSSLAQKRERRLL